MPSARAASSLWAKSSAARSCPSASSTFRAEIRTTGCTDVDYGRTQADAHFGIRHEVVRHGFARGAGGHSDRAHFQSHRAFQDPQEGQPLAPWPSQAREPAPLPPRISEVAGREPLPGADRTPRHSPLGGRAAAAMGPPLEGRKRCGPWQDRRTLSRKPFGLGRAPRRLAHGSAGFRQERIESMFDLQREELEWGGRTLTLETGKLARQADGAVLARYGDTEVLATVVGEREARPGIDFFPLTVNYQERYYATGRIPGGYFKREGRPTERETLTSRLIDRPIRPLFVEGYRNETQVVCTVLSHDLENEPDIVAMVAASAALTLSGVPFMGPIGAARVGYIAGQYVLNPRDDQMPESALDLVVAGTAGPELMVESEAKERAASARPPRRTSRRPIASRRSPSGATGWPRSRTRCCRRSAPRGPRTPRAR